MFTPVFRLTPSVKRSWPSQKHLRILSGLYGLLRPLDLMRPYRLEMGLPLKIQAEKSLRVLGEQITQTLNKHLKTSGSRVLVNLAQRVFQSGQTKVTGC